MNYSFDKHKLPRGKSYPLKRTVLDAALKAAGISKIHCVYYWLSQNSSIVMRAEYCGELNKGWFAAGQSSITLYAVPSEGRKEIETLLHQRGLPVLYEWLRKTEEAGNTWRGVNHYLTIKYVEGKLSYIEF